MKLFKSIFKLADKPLIASTSAFFRHRSFGYETQKELRSDNQAFIFVSEPTF